MINIFIMMAHMTYARKTNGTMIKALATTAWLTNNIKVDKFEYTSNKVSFYGFTIECFHYFQKDMRAYA